MLFIVCVASNLHLEEVNMANSSTTQDQSQVNTFAKVWNSDSGSDMSRLLYYIQAQSIVLQLAQDTAKD